MPDLQALYSLLYLWYGPQGWWPVQSSGGYHPKDYTIPNSSIDRFEICVGAILTQNTSWTQVEQALKLLNHRKALTPEGLMDLRDSELTDAIRPSGYFNQKAKKLRIFTEYFLSLRGSIPARNELLRLWGIGPETADSILLYAFHEPTFVVDAYTTRLLTGIGAIPKSAKYEEMRALFEASLAPDPQVFQEYHALIVAYAKAFYSRRPWGIGCPLREALSIN